MLPDALEGVATATLAATPEGFTLVVRVGDATRTLTAPTCDEATQAAVFFIHLALTEAKPEPEAPVPWTFGVAAFAGGSFVALPEPLARLGVSFRGQRGAWEATLDASSSLPLTVKGGPTAGASVLLLEPLEGQLGLCRLFALGRLDLGPCVDVAAAWLQATGQNVSSPRTTSVAVWSAGPGAHALLRLLDWLELTAQAVVRFGSQPSIYFEGNAPVFQGAPVSVELRAGIGARF